MGCSCQNKRQTFEVVAENGRVVFSSGSEPTARAVAGRYPNSEVRKKGEAGTTTTTTTAPAQG